MSVDSLIRTSIPLSEGWSIVRGIDVKDGVVSINPEEYFYRYEDPEWMLCDWAGVQQELLPIKETHDKALEQIVLDYVREHGVTTRDPQLVLETGWSVSSYLFRDEYASEPDLKHLPKKYFQILREMAAVMSLNCVRDTGHIVNVGPAWFFGVLAQKVFGLTQAEGEEMDDLYHGTFFNESRRIESIKAHAALGGRLVHGCHSSPNMSGGCVVPYGADLDTFTRELSAFRSEWIDNIFK